MSEVATTSTEQYIQQDIFLGDIDLGLRFRKDYGDLTELIASVQELGVFQPICVLDKANSQDSLETMEGLDDSKPYLLLAGGRRTYAALGADLSNIPALIFTRMLDEYEIRLVELHENIKRKDFGPTEKSDMITEVHRLYSLKFGESTGRGDKTGHSQNDTAKKLGINQAAVSQAIKVSEMSKQHPDVFKGVKTMSEANAKVRAIEADTREQLRVTEYRKNNRESPIEVAKKNLCKRYILGDFFENVSKIPDGKMDFIELDPPFAVELEDIIAGGQSQSEVAAKTSGRHYEDISKEDYLDFMNRTAEQIHRAMKPESWGICWFAWRWYADIKRILQDHSLFVNDEPLIWVKPNGRTRNVDLKLPHCYEQFLYFRKGSPSIVAKGRRNWFDAPVVPSYPTRHPAERPVELYQDILSTFCREGYLVLVPFAGSGNTLLAAENIRVNAIGFDLKEPYKNTFDLKVHLGEIGRYTTEDLIRKLRE